jgi:HSP20 family molecular chaperone IbpA
MLFNHQFFRSPDLPATVGDVDVTSVNEAHLVNPVRISENRLEYVFTCRESGLDGNTILTSMTGKILTVKAEIKRKIKTMAGSFPRSPFIRNFSMPDNADIQTLKTSYRNNIMKLKIPKKKQMAQHE